MLLPVRNLIYASSILLIACSTSPEDIPYGQTECCYCRMTVVDNQHAAELVTTTGKVYFFDAIECMVNYAIAHPELTYAHQVVNDFSEPGSLIPAGDAAYLISPQLPSPMGAFLNAFGTVEARDKAMAQHQGEGLTWTEVQLRGENKLFGKMGMR